MNSIIYRTDYSTPLKLWWRSLNIFRDRTVSHAFWLLGDVSFRIRPAFWETWYFRPLGMFLLAMTATVLYRIRVFQLMDQLNRRCQDRLAERTRIAHELHDTLLQGVLSASMQLDITQDRLPEESAARPMLQRVLQLLRQVTEEGREALRGLRSIDSSMSLEAALGRLADDALLDHAVSYRVHVQGDARALRQAVRDEVYRIGREASCNAFSHAKATSIVVTIDYGARAFHLVVSDNGGGIDASILKNGREGHWGLAGMRERAHAIGAVLKVRSRVPGGTEVELVVPAIIAYADRRPRKLWPSGSRID
jgi:signal transduction histidine kinase